MIADVMIFNKKFEPMYILAFVFEAGAIILYSWKDSVYPLKEDT